MWETELNFISKNPFEILRLQSKDMDKGHRGIGRNIFFDIF